MSIRANNISKTFGKFRALDRVTIDAPTGRLVALLGPSGSGKTTLLRIIAGLETADSGTVHYADDDVSRHSARERNIGFVFQHYALFRHMTVFENVAFGMRVRKAPEAQVKQRVGELLDLVRLPDQANKFPHQLSGGQKQRVALVRALAPQPRVMLLDEPFGALDAKVREELRQWLRRIHDETHVSSIFVTHDQEEAFAVADQIVVMNFGRIEQSGTPAEVFEHPANAFVMDFIGNVNIFPARVTDGRAWMGGLEVAVPHASNGEARVYVRPHELDIELTDGRGASLPARVVHVNPAGSVVKIRVMADEFGLIVNVDVTPERYSALRVVTGDKVFVAPRKARVFAPAPDYSI